MRIVFLHPLKLEQESKMTSIVSTESVASAAPGKRSASPAPPHWYERVGVGGLAVVAIQSEGFFGGAPFGPSLFAATVDRQIVVATVTDQADRCCTHRRAM